MSLTLSAPAKVNLHLRVLGRRPDGYHELATLMLPLDLCDRLTIDQTASGVELTCDDPALAGPGNLAARAAEAFFKATGLAGGARIHLEKNIPVAAGLGGGSSDAATVLMGLNRMHGGPLDAERLGALAAGLGADVPFFLAGGPAWCTGIGEIVEPVRGLPPLELVLVNPGFKLSTAWVYAQYDLTLKKGRVCNRISRPSRQPIDLKGFLVNDLEGVSIGAHPGLADIKALLITMGAWGALMSGSGPTVFGVFEQRGAAKDAAQRIADQDGWWVRHCSGVILERPG